MEKIDLFTILPLYCFAIFHLTVLPFCHFNAFPFCSFFAFYCFAIFLPSSLLERSSETVFCSCCLLKFLFSSQKMFLLSSQKCKVLSPHIQCHAKFICLLRQNTNDHTLLLALILLEHLHNSTVSR